MSQPSPLYASRQRAQALAGSGDLAQARAVLEHAVELGRLNLGEDDPDVLLTAQQLATLHQQAGDPSGARRVLEEAYAAGQWRLGDGDPVMLGISFDLGVVAEEMENRHEARRAFGRVAAHGPAVLGTDHWAVARARAYLGDEPPTVRIELPAPPPAPAPAPVAQPAPPPAPQPAPMPVPHIPAQRVTYVEQPPPHVISVPPITTAVPAPATGGRSPALFAAIAAGLGVVIAVAALVVVLARSGDDGGKSDVPTLSGPAPTDVRVRDYGASVQLFWADPANGRTSFMITGGHPGEQLKPMGQVGPTTTSFNLNGLNPELDYCFAVVAVYSTSQFATSPQACTSRTRSDPSPRKSRR
ncbi:tetratricopeptide repeat protein [Couchioplanes caeruleus]|uniref:tetratricopeptide repeat protein n=1 Tax=Couchioplanes caeruleus TaxID=56438 RepID=UPI0020BE52E4|nr:tetratricopeptide repeat protein [Couchioplanes caeruleus]UQU62889.1 tetratricopeptide repeat protein [Couchioplanes caeruleus]